MNKDEWFSSRAKLGILGGGQLGKMLLEEAIKMDISVAVMDPSEDCACADLTPYFTKGSLQSFEDVVNFGKSLEVLSIEIEAVNTEALLELKKQGVKVFPEPETIALIQDKGAQKAFYTQHKLPTANFALWKNITELKLALENGKQSFPFVWKLCKGGYDGRGVRICRTLHDLEELPEQACISEDLVDFKMEFACIGARSPKGKMKCFPLVGMAFHPEANQVEDVFVPFQMEANLAKQAEKICLQLMEVLDHKGLLAVEFFLTKAGTVLVNECAPRPHNSGHIFSDVSQTSQFEQHLRAICGLPFGSTKLHSAGIMVNLTGESGYSGQVFYDGAAEALKISGTHLHLYGKKETRPFRKMGHVNVVAANLKTAEKKADKVRKLVKIKSK